MRTCTYILYNILRTLHIHIIRITCNTSEMKIKTKNRFVAKTPSAKILSSRYILLLLYYCDTRLVQCLRVAAFRARPSTRIFWYVCVRPGICICAPRSVVVAKNYCATSKVSLADIVVAVTAFFLPLSPSH